jgi:hypothetical protein
MAVMHDAPTAPEPVLPPVPEPLPEGLSTRKLIRAYATNVLATYPERAFEDDVGSGRSTVGSAYWSTRVVLEDQYDVRRIVGRQLGEKRGFAYFFTATFGAQTL